MAKTKFRNRIIGTGQEDPEQLLANPRNWRIHPKAQQEALQSILEEVGWVDDVIVNQRTGFVVDGHLRVAMAISNDQESIPVKYVDLNENEESMVLATIDPIAMMATTDKELLEEVLASIQTDNENVRRALEGIAKSHNIRGLIKEEPSDAIDRAEELQEKWRVERGQVWKIGDHRLMCGDSTSEYDVGELMNDEKAQFCFTDPPYGVKYTGGTKKWAMLENDDEINMYAGALPIIYNITDDRAVIYLAFADANAYSVYKSISDAGYIQRALIIWNKNHAQFGSMGSQYKQKHEPIAYCYKKGKSAYWFGPNNEVTVWDIDRASANEFHPTQKPVDLVVRAMTNSCPTKGLAVDLFLGSGTTMVAAQQLGRICYGMEIEPKYCAVTLERMSQMGPVPELVDT